MHETDRNPLANTPLSLMDHYQTSPQERPLEGAYRAIIEPNQTIFRHQCQCSNLGSFGEDLGLNGPASLSIPSRCHLQHPAGDQQHYSPHRVHSAAAQSVHLALLECLSLAPLQNYKQAGIVKQTRPISF